MTKAEVLLIHEIAERAHRTFTRLGVSRKKIDWILDLEAAHKARPLNLAALLEAEDTNFNHDLGGIMRYMNRESGQLEGCFVPRFARRV